jgi:hypothetical protein
VIKFFIKKSQQFMLGVEFFEEVNFQVQNQNRLGATKKRTER